MSAKGRNDQLQRLMHEAGFTSHKSLARAVVEESALVSGPFQRCDHTDVARWISGMTPRGSKPAIIAAAIGRRLGRKVTVAEIGMASSAVVLEPHLGLAYPDAIEAGTDSITALWHADLSEATQIVGAKVDASAWSTSSLRWLVSSNNQQRLDTVSAPRVGPSDIHRFKETVKLFAELDNRFGGGHGRKALIQYLATDGERLLRGRFTDAIGKTLYAAIAEATLLAAWMSYDSAPGSGLAQRYFIQALALADTSRDRRLGATILDAMSHQATFVGRYRDAANLAMAARTGTAGIATPTQTAHFHSMEARALARLGDAKACSSAIAEAIKIFDRRDINNDPEWIQYFDAAELSAEISHCFRDLGRPVDAAEHATRCLTMIDTTTSPRSRFFAYMVLADAYLNAGEVEQAYETVAKALNIGEQLRSARCVNYVHEFRTLAKSMGAHSGASEFEEHAREYRIWRLTSAVQR